LLERALGALRPFLPSFLAVFFEVAFFDAAFFDAAFFDAAFAGLRRVRLVFKTGAA
jgi:hypothetical protein